MLKGPKQINQSINLPPHPPSYPRSDYGFKPSEDLSLELCVPDPEFAGRLDALPTPCPAGTTYRRSKG